MSVSHPKHTVFSPARIIAIASNSLLDLVRQKVFYFLLVFASLLIASSFFMINFSFQEQFQVLKDVSLGSMSIFTWLLAVLATAMLLPKDIEDRTLYTILAKPVPRFEYLLGKLLGVLMMLLVSTVIMSALFSAILYAREQVAVTEAIQGLGPKATAAQIAESIAAVKQTTFSWSLIPAIVAIYIKAALFASLTLLISTFASSWIFTVVISVAVYIIGNIQPVAREYWRSAIGLSDGAKIFLDLASLPFPDVQLFNLVDDIAAGNTIGTLLFLKIVALGATYITVYLCLAYFMFSEKEL